MVTTFTPEQIQEARSKHDHNTVALITHLSIEEISSALQPLFAPYSPELRPRIEETGADIAHLSRMYGASAAAAPAANSIPTIFAVRCVSESDLKKVFDHFRAHPLPDTAVLPWVDRWYSGEVHFGYINSIKNDPFHEGSFIELFKAALLKEHGLEVTKIDACKAGIFATNKYQFEARAVLGEPKHCLEVKIGNLWNAKFLLHPLRGTTMAKLGANLQGAKIEQRRAAAGAKQAPPPPPSNARSPAPARTGNEKIDHSLADAQAWIDSRSTRLGRRKHSRNQKSAIRKEALAVDKALTIEESLEREIALDKHREAQAKKVANRSKPAAAVRPRSPPSSPRQADTNRASSASTALRNEQAAPVQTDLFSTLSTPPLPQVVASTTGADPLATPEVPKGNQGGPAGEKDTTPTPMEVNNGAPGSQESSQAPFVLASQLAPAALTQEPSHGRSEVPVPEKDDPMQENGKSRRREQDEPPTEKQPKSIRRDPTPTLPRPGQEPPVGKAPAGHPPASTPSASTRAKARGEPLVRTLRAAATTGSTSSNATSSKQGATSAGQQ